MKVKYLNLKYLKKERKKLNRFNCKDIFYLFKLNLFIQKFILVKLFNILLRLANILDTIKIIG